MRAAGDAGGSGIISTMSATADDHTRLNAEIAQLNAETARLQVETARIQAETLRLQAEARKLDTEPAKIRAETVQIERETGWLPLKVFGGALGGALAIFAAAAGFLKFLEWLKP
jgi:IS4 transposase